MRLEQYSEEELDFLLETHAKTGVIQRTLEAMGEVYPDAHKYQQSDVSRFLTSDEGAAIFGPIKDRFEAEALKIGIAVKATRLSYLNGLCTKMWELLEPMKPGDKGFIPLNREFRETLKDAKAEMEGEGLKDTDAMGSMLHFFDILKGPDSPKWAQNVVQSLDSPETN